MSVALKVILPPTVAPIRAIANRRGILKTEKVSLLQVSAKLSLGRMNINAFVTTNVVGKLNSAILCSSQFQSNMILLCMKWELRWQWHLKDYQETERWQGKKNTSLKTWVQPYKGTPISQFTSSTSFKF